MVAQLDLLNAPILGVFVTAGYAVSPNHASLADIPVAARIAFTGTLSNRTVSGGVFSADSATAVAVYGDVIQAIALVSYSGTDSSSPLVAYLDQSPDLPYNPNGSTLVINWDTTAPSKIFAF